MDRAHLERVFDDLDIKTVSIYFRLPTGEIDTSFRIVAENSEQRPIDFEDEHMFSKISCEIERCVWVFFTPAFSIHGSEKRASNVQIPHGSIVKDHQGGKEWLLVRPVSKMRGTTWRCPSVERIGDSLVKGW